MNILIIGSGGREHAVCLKFKESSKKNHLYCIGSHKNPGIYDLCEDNGYYITENKLIVNIFNHISNKIKFDFVFIGPEAPLEEGIVDFITEHNDYSTPCVGPCKSLAMLETSKSYSRTFMKACGMYPLHCPKFYCLDSLEKLDKCIEKLENEFVIKADGLKGGKGVKVFGEHLHNHDDTIDYCTELLKTDKKIVIEEKLYGKEYSLITFSDGSHFKHCPIVQDYKRLLEGDKGPNTGGMGSISFSNHKMPFLSDENVITSQQINEAILTKIKDIQGIPYKGILYGSFMKTNDGDIKIIEFNCRFGDPECINILHLLKSDFIEVCLGIVHGTLDSVNIEFENKSTVCKYIVPDGYPCKSNKTSYITGIDNLKSCIHSSIVESKYNIYLLQGSRAVAIIHSDVSMSIAEQKVEQDIGKIKRVPSNVLGALQHRTDIGKPAYLKSGVNIENANQCVSNIQELLKQTHNSNVLSTNGDFAGLYKLDNNILVSSTDGVGTKSHFMYKYFGIKGLESLGQDLVNHCVNDILVKGAEPLFFLDYYGTHKINKEELYSFVKGVSQACKNNSCALVGGETAEMPLIYDSNKFDLVGTIVGKVNQNTLIEGKKNIKDSNIAFGLYSDGLHTNGYSLVNKLVDQHTDKQILSALSKPHKSYLQIINQMRSNGIVINGLAHITGGGLHDNINRVIPENTELDIMMWDIPVIYKWLQVKGNISDEELLQVFNCGMGMVVFVDKEYEKVLTDNFYNVGQNIGIIKKNINI